MFNTNLLNNPKIGEITTTCLQVGSVLNGSVAHAAQVHGHVSSVYTSLNSLYSNYTSVTELYSNNKSELLQLGKSITSLTSAMFSSTIGDILHSSLEIHSAAYDWMNGKKKDAIVKISFSALSLTAQLTLSVHARVALVVLTALLDLSHSAESFRNERYIESLGSFACSVIRVRKNRDLFHKCRDLWTTVQIERRTAIDVGSGGTKVIIADVNPKTGEIIKVIHEESIPVAYQKDLENSSDGAFSTQIQEKGIRTFQKIQQLAKEHQATRIYAVATAAFRASTNGDSFARKITESTGVPVRIISQFEEGVLAHESARNSLPLKDFVCWDIGTGSFQMTSPSGESYNVYMADGSVPFQKYIIEHVKGLDPNEVNNPLPLSKEDIKKASREARRVGREVLKPIKKDIKRHGGEIVGIGRVFGVSLEPLANEDGIITRKNLRKYIRSMEDKTPSDPFAGSDMSNAIFALWSMVSSGGHTIRIVKDATSSKGVLGHKEFWKSSPQGSFTTPTSDFEIYLPYRYEQIFQTLKEIIKLSNQLQLN